MNARSVLERWIELFNQQDAENLAELYHQDAVNHQVANEPIIGRDAIKQMFVEEFKAAEMECIPVNIFEDGEWAIMEWKDPLGLRGCGFFHVVDELIVYQRGYFDQLSFFKIQNLPIPDSYLDTPK